ncbi:MAG: hypothetical protein EBT34_07005, partial [Acetobacteraceae bacterium]|nr:hypothetical protein [Acetobacteraceae bacterium]
LRLNTPQNRILAGFLRVDCGSSQLRGVDAAAVVQLPLHGTDAGLRAVKQAGLDVLVGVKHALPARRDILDFEVAKLKELLPGATWTAAGIGRHQFEVARWALEMGGHIRTGLEDNIRLDRNTLAPSNAALVTHVAALAAAAGRPIATAVEARKLLGLPERRKT